MLASKKYVAIKLLNGETVYCMVEVKARVQELLEQIGKRLGVAHNDCFGLALFADNEYRFVNQDTKISKYAPKQWKALNNSGFDESGKPLVTFRLRIQFYVDCHLLIRDKVTRLHYYLQLRENVLKYSQTCSEERFFLLCAFALQADVGSFCAEKHQGQYFEPKAYFPTWVVNRVGEDYIVQNVPAMHKDNCGLSQSEAQMAYIREASLADAPHNMHLYRLRKKKSESKDSVWLGICPKGIELYEDVGGFMKQLWSTFLWANISKLCFEKKKFEISYPNTRKYTYYASTDEKAKYLLSLCKSTHQFTMSMQPKVAELRRLEQEVKKSYRESYIYSDSFDLQWEQEQHGSLEMSLHDFSTLPKTGKGNDQRISVISNSSSNTTSGIVSDRVQSLDGSEVADDLEHEIMINSPPGHSSESLPYLTLSDQEDGGYDCQSLNVVSASLNTSDICMDVGLVAGIDEIPSSANSTLPLRRHSKTASNPVSRADSASSQQSASTIKSRSQDRENSLDSFLDAACNALSNSDDLCASNVDSTSNSPVYFLPKMEPFNGFRNSSSDHDDRYTCSSLPHAIAAPPKDFLCSQEDETAEFPSFGVSDAVASAPATMPRTTSSNTSSLAGTRILTSIGVQAPILPPPNLQLPHARTKIGVSSLSRQPPPLKQFDSLQASNSFCNQKTKLGSNSQQLPSANSTFSPLPPTAMYGADSGQPTSMPPLTNGFDRYTPYGGFQFERFSLQTIPASPLDKSPHFFAHSDGHSLPVSVDYSNDLSFDSSDELSSFSLADFPYIPPPPLYANPDTLCRFSESCNGSNGFPIFHNNGVCVPEFNGISPSHFQLPLLLRPPVTRARSEESCRSLETMRHVVSVSRAQSMDRRPKTDYLNDVLPPPPSYRAQPLLNGDDYSPSSSASSLNTASLGSNEGSLPPLDIDNLRKRSKDLDLPLISALCNDRSLMQPPSSKSPSPVPSTNCQRRLSCETPTSPPLAAVAVSSRPLSWHVSSEVHWPLSHASSSDSLPGQPHWQMSTSRPITSIMTSFGKTGLSPKHSPASSFQNGQQQQLFPMKLSVLGQNGSCNARKLNAMNVSVA